METADSTVENTREALRVVEGAARSAVDVLMSGLLIEDKRGQSAVERLRVYCCECRDSLQSLEVARLVRWLVDDVDGGVGRPGERASDWARAAVQIHARASRVARLLREQGSLLAEQALIDLLSLHLAEVEDNPRYAFLTSELRSAADGRHFQGPLTVLEEVFGRPSAVVTLPTCPPRYL